MPFSTSFLRFLGNLLKKLRTFDTTTTRAHSFPHSVEFQAKPRNLLFYVEF